MSSAVVLYNQSRFLLWYLDNVKVLYEIQYTLNYTGLPVHNDIIAFNFQMNFIDIEEMAFKP